MNPPTIIVLLVVSVCVVLALRSIIRNWKKGNYCSGCSGCGNSCSGCSSFRTENCAHCARRQGENAGHDSKPAEKKR